jgi:hypothetical protein
MNPTDEEFYLLETLPGVKARLLRKATSQSGVFSLFYWKWRRRDSLDDHIDQLRGLLGNAYDPSYSDFLAFIDPQELALSESANIGAGSFGTVYKVPWTKKPLVLFDHVEEKPGDVAVKVTQRRDDWNYDTRRKFISEASIEFDSPTEIWQLTNGLLVGHYV